MKARCSQLSRHGQRCGLPQGHVGLCQNGYAAPSYTFELVGRLCDMIDEETAKGGAEALRRMETAFEKFAK